MPIRSLFCGVGAVSFLAVAGCGGERLWPLDSQVTAPEGVRIDADSQGVGMFSVRVTNNTGQMLNVNRDAVVLETPKGERHRLPSKGDTMYSIAPGSSGLVTVKFDTHDLDDHKVVTLKFDGALVENGQDVKMPQMQYETRSE